MRHWKALVFFLTVTLLYCREAFLSGHLLFTPESDWINSVYSSMAYFQCWIRQGIFPLWNTLSMCGHTFGLNSISYPSLYHLLSIFLDLGVVYNLVIMMSLFLNGVFLYLFLARKGLSRYAAFAGGLIWMLSKPYAVDTGFFSLPLCFFLADRYLTQKSRLNFTLFTLAIAFYSLNANPQYFLYGALMLFFYVVFCELKLSPLTHAKVMECSSSVDEVRRQRTADPSSEKNIPLLLRYPVGFWKSLLPVVFPFILAAMLGMFYFVPFFELAVESNRSNWSLVEVLLPSHLLQMVFPGIFKSITRPDLDFLVSRILQGIFSGSAHFKDVQAFTELPYLGLFPVLAVFFCALSWAKQRWDLSRFFLSTAVFVLLYLALHPFIYHGIVNRIPFLSGMTAVTRLLDIYQFSLAVVAACAVDLLLHRSNEALKILKKASLFFATLIGGLFVGLQLLKTGLHFLRAPLSERIVSNLKALQSPNPFITDTLEFQKRRVEDFFYFFDEILSFKNPHLLLPAVLVVILLSALFLYQKGRIKALALKIFLVIFILMDMGLVIGFACPSASPKEILKDAGIANFMRRDKGLYRVITLEDKTRSFHRMFLRPESNLIYGIATPDGYEQLYLKRYVRFHELLTRRGTGPILHHQDDFDERLADFINCKYIVTNAVNPKMEGRPGYQKIMQGPEYKIFENLNVFPRFFLVHQFRMVSNAEEAELYLKNSPQTLRDEVVLEGAARHPLADLTGASADEVAVLTYQPNKIELKVQAAKEGYLVMTEVFYPGWRAFMDGREVEIERANATFRAVRISAGTHDLQMSYRPRSMALGIKISMIGVLVLFLICAKILPFTGA